MVGMVLPAQADFFELADRDVSDGHEVWTLTVRAEGAVGVNVYFDVFHVPAGAELYFSTPESKFEETWVNGPVTSIENNDHGRWVNRDVPGDEVVMTYRAPVGLTEAATLRISGVGYFAPSHALPQSHGPRPLSEVGAEACQVNVNCPEGDSWECDKSAVVRLQITQNGGVYFCSGSMVNNTALDCRQLLLSSFHCVNDVDEDEWAFLQVRFNYQGCRVCLNVVHVCSTAYRGDSSRGTATTLRATATSAEATSCWWKWRTTSPIRGIRSSPGGTPQGLAATRGWASTTRLAT